MDFTMHLQQKRQTLFLLAMTSAAQVLELLMFDISRFTQTEDWISTTVSTLSEFVAKNQNATTGQLGHRQYTIPALGKRLALSDHHLCSSNDQELHFYMAAIALHWRKRNQLFL